jgi:predicted lipoprotein with Yx(FWY)xxD motif
MRRPLAVGCIATVALIGSGCGGGSKRSASSAATSGANAPSTATVSPAAASGISVTSKSGKLGTILAAGPKRLTVYMFEGDRGASSSCSGGCASVWPPVTSGGSPVASGQAQASDIGLVTRSDGSRQVTYKGHPLYFYARDGDQGDAYGQGIKGFGASWYVLTPSGKKVDNS